MRHFDSEGDLSSRHSDSLKEKTFEECLATHWPLKGGAEALHQDHPLLEALENGRLSETVVTDRHHERVLHFSEHSFQTTRRTGNLVVQVDGATGNVRKVVSFNPDSLNEFWNVVLGKVGTVWQRPHVVQHVLYVVVTGTVISAIVFLSCLRRVDPNKVNYESLRMCTTMLGAFLGFIFATFVNNTFSRWQQVISFIFTYFEQVKDLQFELRVIHGAPRESWERIRRWSMLSIWIATREAPELWNDSNWESEFDQWERSKLMTEQEREVLEDVAKTAPTKRALLVWKWIGHELSELANDMKLPPKISPAFVHIIENCGKARKAIGMLESVIFLQMPYIYVHLLALLVNLFSVLNAIACGVGMGVHAARLMRNPDDTGSWINNTERVIAFAVLLGVGPLIYQTSLSVSLELALPFGRTSADLPMSTLIAMQEMQLQQMTDFAEDPMALSGGDSPSKQSTKSEMIHMGTTH